MFNFFYFKLTKTITKHEREWLQKIPKSFSLSPET